MTVTELIQNFRSALLALQPAVEHVGMPWQRARAYDEWDAIVTAIYNGLIIEPLRWGLTGFDPELFRLADYDMLLPSYADVNVVELLPEENKSVVRVFHALGSMQSPFDVVEWRRVSLDGSPLSEELQTSAFDSSHFAIRVSTNGFWNHRVERVTLRVDS